MQEHKYSWENVDPAIIALLCTDTNPEMTFRFMSQAIVEARRSQVRPTVGAVVVKGGAIIGRGHRSQENISGDSIYHAEYFALREAGKDTKGAIMYATLAPCSTRRQKVGETQLETCCDNIIRAGISELHVGLLDQAPGIRGESIKMLTNSGIKVYNGSKGLEQQLYQIILNGFLLHPHKDR